MAGNLLLVDDNDKYAEILTEYFSGMGYVIERAWNAKEGFDIFQSRDKDYFKVIITDITMETQVSGISMLGKIKKCNYKGTVVVASTGFDVIGVVPLSRCVLPAYRVHYLVPKTTVLKKNLRFLPIDFFAKPMDHFKEIIEA